MNNVKVTSQLIAIVGGSGSGKTWLADRLQKLTSEKAARLSLDDFYLDRSHLPPSRRESINYDNPRAIDWDFFEKVLRDCREGRPTQAPGYDFTSHTRFIREEKWTPKPLIIVDGLWLLHQPQIRRMFDLRIFIHCPPKLRWRRRVERDVRERGRSAASVRRQIRASVAPMHERFVEPQGHWADLVLQEPLTDAVLEILAQRLWSLLSAHGLFPAWMRATFKAELHALLKPKNSKHD